MQDAAPVEIVQPAAPGATAQVRQNPPQPPLAETVSPEARKLLTPLLDPPAIPEMPVATMRAFADGVQQQMSAIQLKRYSVKVGSDTIAGVPVRTFMPEKVTHPHRVLLNFHGGGFTVDSGSLTENIPVASLTGTRIVSALYRMAPEHPFPAAVDDALAVYRALLKDHKPKDIAIFGTSAGAILTIQLLARIKKEGLPMPAAAGAFSGTGDFSKSGDIEGYLPGIGGKPLIDLLGGYLGKTPRTDPLLSPNFSDLHGLPPVLVLTSTRDQLLSQSAIQHRALRKAGVDAELIVYEGMPHAFWSYTDIPESTEAFHDMADFFNRHLGH